MRETKLCCRCVLESRENPSDDDEEEEEEGEEDKGSCMAVCLVPRLTLPLHSRVPILRVCCTQVRKTHVGAVDDERAVLAAELVEGQGQGGGGGNQTIR